MKYVIIVLTWLKQQILGSVSVTMIVIPLAVVFAVVADRWLRSALPEVMQLIDEEGIREWEYWAVLVVLFTIVLFAIKALESLITVVLLTKIKPKE